MAYCGIPLWTGVAQKNAIHQNSETYWAQLMFLTIDSGSSPHQFPQSPFSVWNLIKVVLGNNEATLDQPSPVTPQMWIIQTPNLHLSRTY